MLDISAQLGTFDENLHPEVMAYLITGWIEALAKTNYVFLQMYPDTVPLYQSGVYYREEPFGQEDFFDIPTVLEQGFADCEDLAAWRVAEYWSVGWPAQPIVTWDMFKNGDILFHVRVQSPDGLEDPSALLGMR